MSGCGPSATKNQLSSAPSSSPVSSAQEPEGVTVAESPPSTSSEIATSEPPGGGGGWGDYAKAYEDVKNVSPPVITMDANGIPDPTSILTHANELGNRIQILKNQQNAIESTLSPVEKKQWKQFRNELTNQEGD